jgi:hypothetical protein
MDVGGRPLRVTHRAMSYYTHSMSRPTIILTLLLSCSVAGCNQSERDPRSDTLTGTASAPALATTAAESTVSTTPVAYVDSALPMDEALRRFRADLGTPPAALSPAFRSREALVRTLVEVVERSDTVGLVPLVLTSAEFAYMYYPTNPLARPPYALAPALMWLRLQESNRRAAFALMRAHGGPLGYVGHECTHSERQGANTIWSDCKVRRRAADGAERSERLFGTIIERDGRYKFVGLNNELK